MDALAFVGSTALFSTLLYFRGRYSKKNLSENPLVCGQGRLKSHVCLAAHPTPEEARRHVLQTSCSPFAVILNGVWDFTLCGTIAEALEARKKGHRKGHIWVPSSWQVAAERQGVTDIPLYTNIKYIIPTESLTVPEANPTGYYFKSIQFPPWWAGRRIVVNFGGVDSCMYLYVNGTYIGYSSDSRLPAEFDITHHSYVDGRNTIIEVIVPRFSMGSFLEDQDMWNLSGIFREVTVYALPKPVHIMDFDWKCDLGKYSSETDTFVSAVIHVTTRLEWSAAFLRQISGGSTRIGSDCPHYAKLSDDWEVDISLFTEGVLISSRGTSTAQEFIFDNPEMQAVQEALDLAVPLPDSIGNEATASVQIKTTLNIASASAWSPDRPHVYTLVLSLRNTRTGELVQSESCRVGLRRVSIDEGVLRVNERDVLIRGVNWHEHDPITGHSISFDLIEADINLMKRNNFNAVRTSHYPQTQWTYELCSLYGLYVVDEANIETHGMKPYTGRLADDPDWRAMYMDRITRMYQRDKVHPSIICWSLGNESGYGFVHDEMATWLRAIDKSRPIMYEPCSFGHTAASDTGDTLVQSFHDGNATDIICPMYPRIDHCVKLADQCQTKPVILCEYAHMMGNSGGNFADYWEAFRRHRRLQGGFVWDWADQGLSVCDPTRQPFWCYGGDHCENPLVHDAQFCINGITWPDRGLGSNLSDARHMQGFVSRREMANYERSCGLCPKDFIGSTAASSPKKSSYAKVEEIEDVPTRKAPDSPRHMKKSKSPDIFGSFHEGINVNRAMSKPQLLEAKVCMQPFECVLINVECWPSKKAASVVTFDRSEQSKVVQRKTFTHKVDEWEMLMRVEFTETQDCTSSTRKGCEYQCYLLYDGLVVGQQNATRVVDLANNHCYATFSINVHPDKQEKTFVPSLHKGSYAGRLALLGYRWPETTLLEPNSDLKFPESISEVSEASFKTNNIFKAPFRNDIHLWSAVVVAVTSEHTAWAPSGFPLGLQNVSFPPSDAKLAKGLDECYEIIGGSFAASLDQEPSERKCTTSMTWTSDNNVLLQAEMQGDTVLAATISSKTGTLRSLVIGEAEVLDGESGAPMRVQLHRAPTDNDIGYRTRWRACGYDRLLEYVPKRSRQSKEPIDPGSDLKLGEKRCFECVSIQAYDTTSMRASSLMSNLTGNFTCCVETKWEMEPASYNANLVAIAAAIQSFADDPEKKEEHIRCPSADEEAFVYEVSNMLSLKRETLSDTVTVVLSKPEPFFINSTTKSALGLVAPPTRGGTASPGQSVGDKPRIFVTMLYALCDRGRLGLSVSIDTGEIPISVPRVGLQLSVSGTLSNVLWRGAGPHECYPDRSASSVDAIHMSKVEHMTTPYMVPSENGSRTGVSWVSLSQSAEMSGTRLIVDSENSRFDFSAQKFSTETLAMMTHSSYLDKPRGNSPIFLNIDGKLMGVGGDDSWSACVHKKYTIEPGCHQFSVSFG